MYLKYVILDGFKCYRRETIVGPFGEHYNAITGLNGTGKSSIVHAICFVLGISELEGQNLEDFFWLEEIDKRTWSTKMAKASVVLDNTDKRKCPPGYENCSEIVVSRRIERLANGRGIKSQYRLNGAVIQEKALAKFFQSIHLDVKNPNFILTTQKLQKVANMTPKELFQMILNSVGRRLFDVKGAAAICKKLSTEFDLIVNIQLELGLKNVKLVPVNPDNYEDGVKIRFCNRRCDWEGSLTELSPAQRSLVALAVISAISVYNPAPFYILNRIDSQLWYDSITSIRDHVQRQSSQVQFICVSHRFRSYKDVGIVFTLSLGKDGTVKVQRAIQMPIKDAQGGGR